MLMVMETVVPHPSETTEVPHPSKTIEVPHPSETKALTTTVVTPQTPTKAPATGNMDVTPPIETKVIAPAST